MDKITIVRKRLFETLINAFENFETRTFYDPVYTNEDQGKRTEEGAQDAVEDAAEAAEDTPEDTKSEVLDSRAFYARFVERSQEQCALELQAPQRSKAWLEARKYVVTASNFGAAVGNNKFCSPEQAVLDKLWSSFKGNEYTQFGTFHEPDARASFERLLDNELKATLQKIYGQECTWSLYETGLLKSYKQPWMAVSPDGILKLSGANGPLYILVEYKCPARLRDSDAHPYNKSPNWVPEYYMDQMQGILGLLNKFPELLGDTLSGTLSGTSIMPAAFFVVWQKHQVHVTLVPYSVEYYTGSLEPKLEEWFFKKFLPLAILKHNGLLIHGTANIASTIVL